MENNEQVARTILEQLGGRRFTMMTGAKNLSYGSYIHPTPDGNGIARENVGLTFKLPIGKAGACRIELDAAQDTYEVTFYKREQLRTIMKNGGPSELSHHTDVYFDGLRELFERETGLCLTLGKVVFA